MEPLKRETFLSNAEINALFGNIQEIVTFQRQFLQNLDEALEMEPDFHKFEYPSQFKVKLLCVGNFAKLTLFNFRTSCSLWEAPFFIMLITLNCTVLSVRVIAKLRRFYIQVSLWTPLKASG